MPIATSQNDPPINNSNRTSFNGTGKITIPARPIQQTNVTSSTFRIQMPVSGTSSKHLTPPRNHVNLMPTPSGDMNNNRSIHSSISMRPKSPIYTVTTRSRSVGPTIIPPPPNANAYPFVTDLSKGLKIISNTGNANNQIASRVQALPPKKFILGRVASNEDICIETETPFAFSIAAKGKQICISKVASADDLQRPLLGGLFNAELANKAEIGEGIPVSLRLTFGSTPCVSSIASKQVPREPALHKTFRSVLHIDMSSSGNSTGKNLARPQYRAPKPLVNGTSYRNSLPSLPRPPRQTQGANLTFFEQDICLPVPCQAEGSESSGEAHQVDTGKSEGQEAQSRKPPIQREKWWHDALKSDFTPKAKIASEQEYELTNHLFNEQGYNPLIRPVANASEALQVDLGLCMIQLIYIDERRQVMKSNVWLPMVWRDYQLTWDPSKYGGLKVVRVPHNRVWKPDIVLFNK
ncbi:unnamed protein product [Rodentolepis nana]|uniref:Neur_chan_LBD domain-containing protein n=1 Tax=Rodentolepis nana TaxID=102285 RepID=A0A0R3T9H0_RODNA|nr:unnamed protein product [Rodentolepis nana]